MKKAIFFLFLSWMCSELAFAQEKVVTLSRSMFQSRDRIFLAPMDGWVFRQGNDQKWSQTEPDTKDWTSVSPVALTTEWADASGRIECWFRLRFQVDSSLSDIPLGISRELWAASDIYLDGKKVSSFGQTGTPFKAYNPVLKYAEPLDVTPGKEHVLAMHVVHYESIFSQREIKLKPHNLQHFISVTGPAYNPSVQKKIKETYIIGSVALALTAVIFLLFLVFMMLNPGQKVFLLSSVLTLAVFFATLGSFLNMFTSLEYGTEIIVFLATNAIFLPVMHSLTLLITERVLINKVTFITIGIFILMPFTSALGHVFNISWPFGIIEMTLLGYFVYLVVSSRKSVKSLDWTVVFAMVVMTLGSLIWVFLHKYFPDDFNEYEILLKSIVLLSAPILLLMYVALSYKNILKEKEAESRKLFDISEEKKRILEEQKEKLEEMVEQRTTDLQHSLAHLKATQAQLIQSEKMASLGELTAGIAHEIQNPLNFVNNFSEVSNELLVDMVEEADKGNVAEVKALASDVRQNLEKIHHHGKRASSIVKGMLEHSRAGSGQKELTDINALCEEYLKLAYHGIKARDNKFPATFETRFDPVLPKIPVVPQDIGRVVLNVINNAFYAVNDKYKEESQKPGGNYLPAVSVSTKREGDNIKICTTDNGSGIPEHIKDKIFQPFFTTKPTGQGTGLGLSLSYDIVKAHSGLLTIQSREGEGTDCVITLPLKAG